jgi:hypothetical protein
MRKVRPKYKIYPNFQDKSVERKAVETNMVLTGKTSLQNRIHAYHLTKYITLA